MTDNRIRVLIVDDSPIARALLRASLEQDPGIEVVDAIGDGEAAIAAVSQLRPDVITMDVMMPGVDGYQAVERIMAIRPTPILVVTDLEPGAVVFRMLSAGAVDIVRKPLRRDESLNDLIRRVLTLGQVDLTRLLDTPVSERLERWTTGTGPLSPTPPGDQPNDFPVVCLVASAGGPKALAAVLTDLPDHLKAAVVIVQHVPRGFAAGMAEWLSEFCGHTVRIAADGEHIQPGRFYLAPDSVHLEFAAGNTFRHVAGPPHLGVHPAADIALRSAAEHCGNRVLAVVLTGMGDDGRNGAQAVKAAGGRVLVQDEATSLIYGMPRAAKPFADAERPLPLIAGWILRQLRVAAWQEKS